MLVCQFIHLLCLQVIQSIHLRRHRFVISDLDFIYLLLFSVLEIKPKDFHVLDRCLA
jgi:hypothetical protein